MIVHVAHVEVLLELPGTPETRRRLTWDGVFSRHPGVEEIIIALDTAGNRDNTQHAANCRVLRDAVRQAYHPQGTFSMSTEPFEVIELPDLPVSAAP